MDLKDPKSILFTQKLPCKHEMNLQLMLSLKLTQAHNNIKPHCECLIIIKCCYSCDAVRL